MVFVIVYAGLLFCVPSQLIVGPVGAPGTPANLWGICALLWWVCATLGGKNPTRGLTPIRAAVGLMTTAVLCSFINGSATGWYAPVGVHQSSDELWTLLPVSVSDLNAHMVSASGRGLLSFAGWAGIILLTAEGLRSWDDLNLLIRWVVRFGTFVASLGILQYFTGIDIAGLFQIPGLVANSDFGAVGSRSILNRVSSTAVHPIEFGVVMAGVFPLALQQSMRTRILRRWIPTALIGAAIPMSVSRSAILALAVASVILIVGWPPRWRHAALVLTPILAVVFRLMVPGLLGTIRSLFTNLVNDPSIKGRTDDYAVLLSVYSENPIFGRGLFTFVPRYYRIMDNQMLVTLVELGAFGLLAVLILLVAGYSCARAARRRALRVHDRNLALAISAAIAGVFSSFVTFDAWGFPMAAGLSFLLLGMAGAAWGIAVRESKPGRAAELRAGSPGTGGLAGSPALVEGPPVELVAATR